MALTFGVSVVVFLIIRLIPGDPAIVRLGTNAGDPSLVARPHWHLGSANRSSGASRRTIRTEGFPLLPPRRYPADLSG